MNINNYHFTYFELVIFLLVFAITFPKIKPHLRSLMFETKPSKRLLYVFDSLFSESNLPWVSSLFLLFCCFFLFIFQQKKGIEFIKYDQANFDLGSVYGFVIGIISVYGIYIGFLQFIVGDSDKVRYFGKSKIKYLVDNSIWYQVTQTKLFLAVLFITIVSPVFIVNTSGEMKSRFIYAWQSSIIISLLIYIFLIGISLQIVRIMFLIKGKTDIGLEFIIKNSIRTEYYRLFGKMYRNKFSSESESDFFNSLKFDIPRVDDKSLGLFLIEVFKEISSDICSKYGKFKSVRIEKCWYGENEKKYLYDDYKRFLIQKWELLDTIKTRIDWNNFVELINMDICTMDFLVAETPKVYEKNNSNYREHLINKDINIHEYLFEHLLKKVIFNNSEINKLYDSIGKFINVTEPDLLDYKIKVKQYKWEKVVEYYLNLDSNFELPKFNSDNEKEYYSESVFNYLINKYGSLEDAISDNKKLMNLVDSMNKKYRISYYLYQIFYPDSGLTKNIIFFQKKLKDTFCCISENDEKELYPLAAKIVSKTHIGHRITLSILMNIFNDKNKVISSMTYFDQFKNCRTSPLKIILTQDNLSYGSNYYIRIDLPDQTMNDDINRVKGLCVDFLRSIDKFPEIEKFDGLKCSMEYLLKNIDLSVELLINDLGIVGLLYYKFILTHKKGLNINTLFLEAITNRDGKEISYFFESASTFTFFALQMMDKNYEKYFNNKRFLTDFKSDGIYFLDILDMSLDEYIESIYDTLKDATHGKVGKASLRQIYNNLEKILFD